MIPSDKVALRAEMRRIRRSLAGNGAVAAEAVARLADDLPEAVAIAIYRAMGSELDPAPLAGALASLGRTLCLPVVIDRSAPMIFRRWTPGEPLEVDAAGCPAPLPLAEVLKPDLILTPLLAFDDFGGRLGQGGGHYDRTFAAMPQALRIGLAYAGQRVERLPVEPHDIALHGVLTEVGYTPARKAAPA
ncbi:5-formyltetrahydrofolate cyclo-ligase [Brevundimonas bacteroides]|uniref:5-formyltetrahydrofolate cyclo-ligase n=1 Tax=Brevundimonas bacteroides TaxID=74311 RepID=UPI0005513780|nr:5-formyltetrahydrofolate cyclo-ligase [Brevundimonas bacteroides]